MFSLFSLLFFLFLQKKRAGRSNQKCSVDSLIQSTTSELGYNKSLSAVGGVSEVSEPFHRISIESITPDLNGTYIEHAIENEKMVDIDNNNEKLIDHTNQEGLFYN